MASSRAGSAAITPEEGDDACMQAARPQSSFPRARHSPTTCTAMTATIADHEQQVGRTKTTVDDLLAPARWGVRLVRIREGRPAPHTTERLTTTRPIQKRPCAGARQRGDRRPPAMDRAAHPARGARRRSRRAAVRIAPATRLPVFLQCGEKPGPHPAPIASIICCLRTEPRFLCSKATHTDHWALWHFRDNVGLAIRRLTVKRSATAPLWGITSK